LGPPAMRRGKIGFQLWSGGPRGSI
jgi:hypothetical protein